MEYRYLGTSDLQVSAVCMGTMTFGQQNTEAEAHAQLDFAKSRGITFFDTAELYPVPSRAETTGRTEEYVGSWLARQPRDQIILATKAVGAGRSLPWIREGRHEFSRTNLREAVEASLRRLQTDYIDLYQLHWPSRNQPMFGQYLYDPEKERETLSLHTQLEALADLVKSGKVRYIGVSNEHPWGVMEFVRLAETYRLPRIVSTQNAHNLLNRVYDFSLAEVCYRENVSLLAYSPLAFGHLSGKYLENPQANGRVTLFEGFAQRYEKPAVQEALRAYADIARRHGLSLAQMALSWCYHRWCVGSTIIGATNMAQLKENIDAWSVQLSAEVLAEIEQVHLRFSIPAP